MAENQHPHLGDTIERFYEQYPSGAEAIEDHEGFSLQRLQVVSLEATRPVEAWLLVDEGIVRAIRFDFPAGVPPHKVVRSYFEAYFLDPYVDARSLYGTPHWSVTESGASVYATGPNAAAYARTLASIR